MAVIESLRKIFRYDLLVDRPIGRGGCGSIWSGFDKLFGRKVAIKTINDFVFWDYPEEARRTFIKEAIAGARLGELSRHIVKVHDLGVTDEIPFFVMEWIEPESRSNAINISGLAGNLSLARAKVILFQISDALQIAHNNGIVHSDIAPWNIIYDSPERLYKLSDFGLLKIVEEVLMSKGSGTLLKGGRAQFQPTEVHQDIHRINYASDVFALAMTFRVLLEGEAALALKRGVMNPTPGTIRIRHEQRDAPDQVRQLLTRFIDGHTTDDRVADFVQMLQRIPN